MTTMRTACRSRSSRASVVRPKPLEARPQCRVRVQRHLRLQADEVLDRVERRQIRAAEQQLARERRTVQSPPAEDFGAHRPDSERSVGMGVGGKGGPMGSRPTEHKAAERAMWALGDYHAFAKQTVWELGPLLVEACGITEGQRVLDVAAGTGNVAIRAAAAGADVVASDLTPENFDAGRAEARAQGVAVEWVEADAEALPFADGEFDAVTSSFGAMFAPDHQQVADELLRVCRPGGTIGMINFTPDGTAAAFFDTLARYAPPPPPSELAAPLGQR